MLCQSNTMLSNPKNLIWFLFDSPSSDKGGLKQWWCPWNERFSPCSVLWRIANWLCSNCQWSVIGRSTSLQEGTRGCTCQCCSWNSSSWWFISIHWEGNIFASVLFIFIQMSAQLQGFQACANTLCCLKPGIEKIHGVYVVSIHFFFFYILICTYS